MFLLFASMIMSIAIMCIFVCKLVLTGGTLTNYIILFLVTLAESLMIGLFCMQYFRESVLTITGVIAFIVLCLSRFAYQTSIDFAGFGPYLLCMLTVLNGMSLVFETASMLGLAGTAAFQIGICAGIGALGSTCYIAVLSTHEVCSLESTTLAQV